MKKLLALAVTSLALTVSALPKDEDLWTFLAADNSNGDRYSVLNKSGTLTKNDNGIPVITARGRIVSKSGTTTPQMWYVPLEHCTAGQGSIVIMDATGNYLSASQFAFNSGTIGGHIAEVMCGAAEKMMTEQPAQAPRPQKKPAGTNV
jgi:hypothetical protein